MVSAVNAKVVKPKDAPKALPWVHTAIANAKSLFRDMYHGIKDEFLQEYLNEFCYKFNRRYFGDRVFDRLIIAAISYNKKGPPTITGKRSHLYEKPIQLSSDLMPDNEHNY